MSRKFRVFFLLSLTFFLIFASITLAPLTYIGEHSTITITVPDDASSINLAIAMAPDGGLIRLRRGIYAEEVYINKSITLMGEEGARILASIKVLGARNITISGISLEIYPAGTEIGIALLNANELRIENLYIIGTGILVANSTNIAIRNCTFTGNPGPAIQIRGSASKNILMENCMFNQTYMALSAQSGSNITFRYNTVHATHLSIKLYNAASNTLIYLNNIMSGEAEDYGTNNKWYNQTLKMGNLWGNPNPEKDKNKDGIIDEPKTIGGTTGSRDEYPLAKQFKEYLNGKEPENMQQDNTAIITITAAAITLLAIILLTTRRHMLKRRGENKIGLENKLVKHP